MNTDDVPTIDSSMLDREPIDFEANMNLFPPVTILLALTCLVVFVWQVTGGALANEQALIDAGALNGPKVWAGEYWRLGTAMFLHGSPDHLIGNLIVLFILGMACEHAYGLLKFVPVYLLGGLAGSAMSLLCDGRTSVGSSGAVFGLAGAMVAFFAKYRREFEIRDQRVGTVLLVWAIYQFVIGFRSPFIDNFAHIGGFLGGVLIGVIVPRRALEAVPHGNVDPM